MRDYINIVEGYVSGHTGVSAGSSIRDILGLQLFQDFMLDTDSDNVADRKLRSKFQKPARDLVKQIFALPKDITITQDIANAINDAWPYGHSESEIYNRGGDQQRQMYEDQIAAATEALETLKAQAGIKSLDLDLSAKQMKAHIIKELLHKMKNEEGMDYANEAIKHYRNIGIDYPEFNKILDMANRDGPE